MPHRAPHTTGTLVPGMTLEAWFTGMSLIGLLSSQNKEPDPVFICKWATDMGKRMADAARHKTSRKPQKIAR